jgi:hypothetical protein
MERKELKEKYGIDQGSADFILTIESTKDGYELYKIIHTATIYNDDYETWFQNELYFDLPSIEDIGEHINDTAMDNFISPSNDDGTARVYCDDYETWFGTNNEK